ncbi:TonB-dependent receptor [Solilutibacter silvestris]|uniref:TonB dependent receptor n=1 Tax=Solilutibacter silvestris TaxID=1645665 RepID=A0A2K1Q0A3_9GAMM|nr:TonB-dependent receptor [Lysobacter silvestris]PNS08469.1 TonB dependent receptor [Lysobacter silvestris]
MAHRNIHQTNPALGSMHEQARTALSLSILLALSSLPVLPAYAQDAAARQPTQQLTPQSAQGDAKAGSDDSKNLGKIVVTSATKRGPRNVQDVPFAVTSLGKAQLDELNFQNLSSLSYTMPNVQLDDVGTMPGYANFSIRGLGINSSIPSIDPTVGIFVDGVYMGISAGMVFDNFDLQNVEILRGPQGVLFGRNVTGGAVLINTRKPTDQFHFDARLGVETGLKTTLDATVRGPLAKGLLDGKLAVYDSHDNGWFTNKFDNRKMGGGDVRLVRGALLFTPTEAFDTTLRVERGVDNGNGPAIQNPALFSSDTFDFSNNAKTFYDSSWNQVFTDSNLKVPFGHGVITNVFGWRQYKSHSLVDIDGTPNSAFHARTRVDQAQWSDELRYAGTFGKVDVTAGYFWFKQHVLYQEERVLDVTPPYDANPPNAILVGGGDGDFRSWGAFLAADWHVSDAFILNFGARYSNETKDADVSRIRPGGGSIDAQTLNPDFPGLSKTWTDVSPKVGFQWKPGAHTHLYGFWTKGFRSGGYNFRHTVLTIPVMAFDAEEQRTTELGLKQEIPALDGFVNVALFRNKIKNIQRESNDPSAGTGVQQIIRNVGDVTVQGVEAEAQIKLGAGFSLAGQVGYTHNKYDKLLTDISGDGIVDAKDYALKLPRAAPWTYGLSLLHDLRIGSGKLSSRISYNHRDAEYYSDNNVGVLNKSNQLDVNFTYTPNRNWAFSLYGRNLLNQVTWGTDTKLPDIPAFGGDGPAGPRPIPAQRNLNRGRVIGADVRYTF